MLECANVGVVACVVVIVSAGAERCTRVGVGVWVWVQVWVRVSAFAERCKGVDGESTGVGAGVGSGVGAGTGARVCPKM